MAWTTILGQPFALRMLQADLKGRSGAGVYLFSGPAGVGKRLTAHEAAKALACARGDGQACDQCDPCRRMSRGTHPDLHVLRPHGASATIPIEAVRNMLGRMALRPYMGRVAVVILDGVDRLTDEAANSLLKLLEEPPAYATFFLLSDQPAQCLGTIVSRCRGIRFQRLAAGMIETLLIRTNRCEPHAAKTVSRLAQGSMAHAEELVSHWKDYEAIMDYLRAQEPHRWALWNAPTDRQALARWLEGTILWLRDVAVASVADAKLVRHTECAESIQQQAQMWDRDRCLDTAFTCMELQASLEEQHASPRLIGTLLREQWLSVVGPNTEKAARGT